MIADYEDDAHFCLKCHTTIIGLENYVSHRKVRCSKNLAEPSKSPLPSQLLPPDESFSLKADDFFSSLELRSSSKKIETQSTSGKNFSGILTRSKTTAAIQATSGVNKDANEPQQSKSGKNVWIGGHQLKELGHGDNQSKLIKAVANLERRKEEPTRLDVYEQSDDDSEEYDYDEDESSSDDQDVPPRNYTGGKWKPTSPIQWSKNTEPRDWNIPPPTYTGGKWKPNSKRAISPPATHTKGKWKPSFNSQKEEINVPPPTFTGSKWVSSKKQDDLDIPPPTFTGSKWISSKKQYYQDIPPPGYTKGKWKPKSDNIEEFPSPSHTKGKWKSRNQTEDVAPPASNTKGKWKPKTDLANEEFSPSSHTNGKWKSKIGIEETFPQTAEARQKSKSITATENIKLEPSREQKQNLKGLQIAKKQQVANSEEMIENIPKDSVIQPQVNYTKSKWIPPSPNITKTTNAFLMRKSNGAVQYWCNPCNRRLASKIVYERHLKSELHFKRTSRDREFDETDDINILNSARSKIKPPEPIFSSPKKITTASGKKRNRKKIYEKCEVCQSKVNKYLIGKHLISHYHCRKGDINSPAAVSMVLDNIHGVVLESPFQCSICKFYCNISEDFLRHWLSEDHIKRNVPGYFYCILCKYKSDDTKSMYDHLISLEHTEFVSVINRSVPVVIKKIRPIRCSTCDKEFMLNVQLLNHCKKFNHDDSDVQKFKNQFVCFTCGIGFVSNISLKRHRQHVHKDIYYVCSPCNLKFDDAKEAKKHRKSLQHKYSCQRNGCDGRSIKKKCEYCKEYFANFLLLKEHLNIKHPEHKIRCPHCGASFTIAQELTTHLRLKSCKYEENLENSLRCEKCPFSSNSTSELIFHLALHDEPLHIYPTDKKVDNNNKPVYKYKCPVCEKFYPKSSLQAHIRQHTEERPFMCNICNKNFARKNNLQFHLKNHEKTVVKTKISKISGERPFLCCTCGASFTKNIKDS